MRVRYNLIIDEKYQDVISEMKSALTEPLQIVPVILCLALIFAFSDSGTIMDIEYLTTEKADTLKSERPAYKPPEEIFIVVEEMPKYPGGEDALYHMLSYLINITIHSK